MTDTELAMYIVMKARERGVITQAQNDTALAAIDAGTFVPKNVPQFVTACTNIATFLGTVSTNATALQAQATALKASGVAI